MIKTFDFVFELRRSEEKRKIIYSMMEQLNDVEYDLRGWHLVFDQKRSIVTITSNGTDEHLEWKFIPAEISYKSLRSIVEYDKDIELQIKFLS